MRQAGCAVLLAIASWSGAGLADETPETLRQNASSTRSASDLPLAVEEDHDPSPRRSDVAFGVGIALGVTGFAAVLVGSFLSLPLECAASDPSDCEAVASAAVGVPLIAGGVVAAGVGIPLGVWGGQRVGPPPAAPARGAVLRWRF